jgi:hypothetical protein
LHGARGEVIEPFNRLAQDGGFFLALDELPFP